MGYEHVIASAIYTGRGISIEDVPAGTIIDMSLRSLKSMPKEALIQMEKYGMISRDQTLDILLENTNGFPKVIITEPFKKRYLQLHDRDDEMIEIPPKGKKEAYPN